MQSWSRSFLTSNLSAVLLMLCLFVGATAGSLIGWKLEMLDAEIRLRDYTQSLLRHGDRVVDAAQSSMSAANRSPFEFCSDNEREYLRNLLFVTDYIKDIGRMSGDALRCTTVLGNKMLDINMPEPKVELDDGTKVYGQISLVIASARGAVLSKGQVNVVLNPDAFTLLQNAPYRFSVWYGRPEMGELVQLYQYPADGAPTMDAEPTEEFAHDRQWHENGDLNAISCSPSSGLCVVVAGEETALSNGHSVSHVLATILGLLGGGVIGAAWIGFRSRDRSLRARLSRALDRKDLSVVYQPIVRVKDETLVGFEALIRWEIAKGDFVPPDILVANAETNGFCGRVTSFVVERVVEDLGDVLRKYRELRITINVTAADLERPEFFTSLEAGLKQANIQASQIGIELTERSAADSTGAIEGIARLRSLGHSVYIDDFGTGYSSLAYLGQLNVDALKIDRAFTQTVGTDAVTVSIVPQIISMALEHNLQIVVEGVETQAQADYFKDLSVSVTAQGWFFGRPVNVAGVRRLIKNYALSVKSKAGKTKPVKRES